MLASLSLCSQESLRSLGMIIEAYGLRKQPQVIAIRFGTFSNLVVMSICTYPAQEVMQNASHGL